MDEAFEVCEDEDMIYELGCDLLKERLQMKWTTDKEILSLWHPWLTD
jgi:hypothetical protein